jgi:hypothetical protein
LLLLAFGRFLLRRCVLAHGLGALPCPLLGSGLPLRCDLLGLGQLRRLIGADLRARLGELAFGLSVLRFGG